MKPLSAESQDSKSLEALGRASVQIVHDVKNQINGLKLYATFLRKRLEKTERPTDELETVTKLIMGLDRTAADLSMIGRFGQPLELRKQAGIDLMKLMSAIATRLNETPPITGSLNKSVVLDSEAINLIGEFDSDALLEAFEWISLGAIKMLGTRSPEVRLHILLQEGDVETRREGVIEWREFDASGHDPFNSFVGSDGIRMSMAARVVEAHGGSAERRDGALRVRLPISP